MTTTLLITLTALLLTLMSFAARGILAAATLVACIGCSKQAESPRPIHWTAPESGYHAESPLPKESQ